MSWVGDVFRRRKRVDADAGRNKAASWDSYPVLTLDNPAGWETGACGTVAASEAMKISAVYCAVQYIGDFVSSLPVYVYDSDSRKRVAGHYLSSVLRLRPNEAQTPSDFKRFLTDNLLLRGNGYAYNYRDPRTGRVVERIPLLADCVEPVSIDGRLRYLYTHPTSGKVYCLDPADVTHYKGHSNNGIKGVSVLRYASQNIHRARSAENYESAVYDNNARPGGVLETDTDLGGLSKTPDPEHEGHYLSKKENVRRAWERVHGGGANAFRTAVLDNGLKYRPIKIDAYDASFVQAKDVSIADIARFFGVPLHALMTGKQSFQSNEQNSLEFVQGRGLAILRAMEEEDTYKLLFDEEHAQGLWIKHNLDGRLRGDTTARANLYRTMHDIGAYSVNDIRSLEDQPDVPGGDIRLASLNYVPLDKFEELSVAKYTNKEVEQ